MGRLFWRLFLGLWLSLVLLLVTCLLLIAFTAERRLSAADHPADAVLLAAGRAMLAAYEASPETGRRLIASIEREQSVHIYFLDDDGRDILGRTPPAFIEWRPDSSPGPGRVLGSLVASPDRPRYAFRHAIRAPSGRVYQTVALLRKPKPPASALLMQTLLGSLALSIALAGLISAVAARHVVKPIIRLRAAAGRLAAGELDSRVGPALRSRKDEFAALADDFDHMADRLGGLLASQQRLMRDLSHELRSPLARMKFALELARGQASPLALIERMDRDADRMDALIGDLLLLARLRSSDYRLDRQTFDLFGLVEEVAGKTRPEAEETGRKITVEADPGLEISADRELLKRALENVVRNALRRSPGDSGIKIRMLGQDGDARVVVADSGERIPEAMVEKAFDPFAHAEDKQEKGSGLALAIASTVVLKHGGRIAIENLPDGQGCEIAIRIPRNRLSPPS